MKYQITITLPGTDSTTAYVSKIDLHDEKAVQAHERRLQKRYPQADISWREAVDP